MMGLDLSALLAVRLKAARLESSPTPPRRMMVRGAAHHWHRARDERLWVLKGFEAPGIG